MGFGGWAKRGGLGVGKVFDIHLLLTRNCWPGSPKESRPGGGETNERRMSAICLTKSNIKIGTYLNLVFEIPDN